MTTQSVQTVCVIGYQGKMGQLAVEMLERSSTFALKGVVGRGDDLAQVLQECNPDIVLDLSDCNAVLANVSMALKMGLCVVVGASGLTSEHYPLLEKLCKEHGSACLIVPNFSLAACCLLRMAQQVAPYFKDCSVLDLHHAAKKDAPSGTAYHCARLVQEAKRHSEQSVGDEACFPEIHSVRSDGYLASHELLLANNYETLRIVQNTTDRAAYEPGMLFALKAVVDLTGVHVGLETLLQL